ncbi:MAG: N(4)-(beta-N-acetylglucosaminyl)-L-asparaginase [Pirellulaceae bacterium]
MDRRTILTTGLLAAAGTRLLAAQQSNESAKELPLMSDELSQEFSAPVFIATWPFGQPACQRALEVITGGASLLDAVERGINVTELDTAVTSVGYGGRPNANGVVQLDACFMDGDRQRAGAVAAIEGYRSPISIARRVMETTKHVMLAGKDAADFAKQQGFPQQVTLTEDSHSAWLRWKEKQAQGQSTEKTHDTIALLGLDANGHLAGGCSTSGLAYKLPGRVGDSPIIGSGLYVDGQVGAAGATGVGENVLRYCASFLIVEFMRQGMSPTAACEAAIRRVAEGDQKPPQELSINFVALNAAGQVGAAGTDDDFRAAIVDATHSLVVQPKLVR